MQDRFIQQLLLQVMTPIHAPGFSEQSFGFRPGRGALIEAVVVRSEEGTLQGGPLSPLLASIHLDPLAWIPTRIR